MISAVSSSASVQVCTLLELIGGGLFIILMVLGSVKHGIVTGDLIKVGTDV